ncbi:MAG: efflux RND transporter periplasmic adaptor subunit [Candidatus Obscuribacterales bacterium]|nr:efflux RND transporter periplasmic adaptor subunit [Candidatus Obscuribacterales bacterium]
MMKIQIAALIASSFFVATTVSAHEGHDKAFGTNTAVVSSSEKITIAPEGQEAMGIKSQPIKTGFVQQRLQATGHVIAAENHSYDITPTVSGVVKGVFAKLGDRVSAGKTLATIYSPEVAGVLTKLLEDRAKFQAEIAKTKTQHERDITVQSKEVVHFESDLKRDEQLFKEGITSKKVYIDSLHSYDTAVVKLEALKKQSTQNVELLKKQSLTTTEAVKSQLKVMGLPASSVDKAVANNRVISEIPILSPVSGIVIERSVTQGETLSSGKKIFSLVNLSPIWVIVDVFQEQIPLVKLGQSVKLTTAAGKTLLGKISDIGTTVDPEDRAIHVRVVTENRSEELKPEMFVTAKIVVAQSKRQQIVVPSSAILDDNGRSLVYVQYGNQFQPVSVKTGSRTSDEVEILDGLFEGDQLVIHGAKQLRSQSVLIAGGLKEKPEEHDHKEQSPESPAPLSIQTLLLGMGVGIIATVICALLIQLGSRASRKRTAKTTAEETEG